MTALSRAEAIEAVDAMLGFARGRLVKAGRPKLQVERGKLAAEIARSFTADLAAYFVAFGERVAATVPVTKADAFSWDPEEAIDFDLEERELAALFARYYTRIGTAAYGLVGDELGVTVEWDINARGAGRVMARVAARVGGITDTSRQLLRDLVGTAVEQGYSIDQLVRGVKDDGFAGLLGTFTDWTAARARMIGLTETATTFNLASIAGYRDSGLVEEVLVFDGPQCGWTSHDDPDLAHGSKRTLKEAEAHPVSHPHCQRSIGAVVAR